MKIKILTLLSIAALAATTSSTWAAGTAAGTDIKNTASISYSVGAVGQTDIYSTPTGNSLPGVPGTSGAPTVAASETKFVVDKKIDLTVTEGADVNVVPGAPAQGITYTLTNTGNSTEFFKVVESQIGSDNFDTTACDISAPGLTGTDTISLAADANATVTVSCNIPASSPTVKDGASSNIDLKATAVTNTGGATAYTETAGADTAAGVEVVLADSNATSGDALTTDGGARNASHSAVNTYNVSTADLSVQKTSAVTNMVINGASDNTDPKRIPGATIQYTILVSNKSGAADHLVIEDILPNTLEFVSCALTGDGVVNAVAPNPALACSHTGETSGGTVSSSSFTIPTGTLGTPKTATLTIDAKVK